MAIGAEKIRDINQYYNSAADAYSAWGGGETNRSAHKPAAVHFGYFEDPSVDLTRLPSADLLEAHIASLANTSRLLLSAARISPGLDVLDAGCGTGDLSRLIGSAGAKAIGINITASQLATAHTHIDPSIAEFVHADYSAIPLADQTMDRVLFLESLCHAPNTPEVINEAGRVLKPGGIVGIGDYLIVDKKSAETGEVSLLNQCWSMSIDVFDELMEDFKRNNLDVMDCRHVTSHMQPSMNLAAASAASHAGEQAAKHRVLHRTGTIEIAKLMANKILGYYFIAAKKRS